MWRTSSGERVLQGPEANLFREILGYVVDQIQLALDYPDCPYEVGIEVFDRLQPNQQLVVLTEVSEALLDSSVRPPDLTAVREGTAAVIYQELEHCIEFEIELDEEPRLRSLVLDAWKSDQESLGELEADGFTVPEPASDDLSKWRELVEDLAEQVFWDCDWEMETELLDSPPLQSGMMRKFMGITDDYFQQIVADPPDSQLSQLHRRLKQLCGISGQ